MQRLHINDFINKSIEQLTRDVFDTGLENTKELLKAAGRNGIYWMSSPEIVTIQETSPQHQGDFTIQAVANNDALILVNNELYYLRRTESSESYEDQNSFDGSIGATYVVYAVPDSRTAEYAAAYPYAGSGDRMEYRSVNVAKLLVSRVAFNGQSQINTDAIPLALWHRYPLENGTTQKLLLQLSYLYYLGDKRSVAFNLPEYVYTTLNKVPFIGGRSVLAHDGYTEAGGYKLRPKLNIKPGVGISFQKAGFSGDVRFTISNDQYIMDFKAEYPIESLTDGIKNIISFYLKPHSFVTFGYLYNSLWNFAKGIVIHHAFYRESNKEYLHIRFIFDKKFNFLPGDLTQLDNWFLNITWPFEICLIAVHPQVFMTHQDLSNIDPDRLKGICKLTSINETKVIKYNEFNSLIDVSPNFIVDPQQSKDVVVGIQYPRASGQAERLNPASDLSYQIPKETIYSSIHRKTFLIPSIHDANFIESPQILIDLPAGVYFDVGITMFLINKSRLQISDTFALTTIVDINSLSSWLVNVINADNPNNCWFIYNKETKVLEVNNAEYRLTYLNGQNYSPNLLPFTSVSAYVNNIHLTDILLTSDGNRVFAHSDYTQIKLLMPPGVLETANDNAILPGRLDFVFPNGHRLIAKFNNFIKVIGQL